MNSGGWDTRTRFVLRLVVKRCLFITEGYVAAADILSLRDNPLSEQFVNELPTFSAREKAFA